MAQNSWIYLDHHATTPVDPRVLEAMLPFFGDAYGNPSSRTHAFGQAAADAVDRARAAVAESIGAAAAEITFTSGATESNRLVLAAALQRGGGIVASAIEHKSIIESGLAPVRKVAVGASGILDPDAVARALRDDDALVCLMLANNEIGTIQPVAEVARVCRARGVPLLCDATAGLGRIPFDARASGADYVSFSAHKFHGPKGAGGLYVRAGAPVPPRPGTPNVPGIVGTARALELCIDGLAVERTRLHGLRTLLLDLLRSDPGGVSVNGDLERRLDGNLSLSFAGVDGPSLAVSLRGLAVSSGAACASTSVEPSHVLMAIGKTRSEALASLRFGIGRFNTRDEVASAASIVAEAVRKLRGGASFSDGRLESDRVLGKTPSC